MFQDSPCTTTSFTPFFLAFPLPRPFARSFSSRSLGSTSGRTACMTWGNAGLSCLSSHVSASEGRSLRSGNHVSGDIQVKHDRPNGVTQNSLCNYQHAFQPWSCIVSYQINANFQYRVLRNSQISPDGGHYCVSYDGVSRSVE